MITKIHLNYWGYLCGTFESKKYNENKPNCSIKPQDVTCPKCIEILKI